METKLEQIAVRAVNQLPKSVVREIRTPRSVGAGGGRPPPATRWMWKRSHGETIEAPPDERGGNRYVLPNATAPHLDSTNRDILAMSALLPLYPRKPTFIVRDGMSQRCQQETHAPQQMTYTEKACRDPGANFPWSKLHRDGLRARVLRSPDSLHECAAVASHDRHDGRAMAGVCARSVTIVGLVPVVAKRNQAN